MLLVTVLLFALCLSGARKREDCDKNLCLALSKEQANVIKGFFILVVFLSHFNGYVGYTEKIDRINERIYSLIGQRMVTMFMLYSGYGVMESIKRKGITYIKAMPINRILSVVFRFDLAVLLYACINFLVNRAKFTFSKKTLLLALLGWESIGNSNWYIFSILICYTATYLAFSLSKSRNEWKDGFILTTVLILCFILFMRGFKLKESSIWYDTVLCYSCGMCLSIYQNMFYKYFNDWPAYACGIICILFFQALSYKFGYCFLLRELALISFSILVVMLTMKIGVSNPFLKFCGEHLFGIYIMQRIPMIIFEKLNLHVYLYFVLCFLLTMVLAVVFDRFTKRIWTVFGRKVRERNG